MKEIAMDIGKAINVNDGTIMDAEDTVMSSVLFYYVDQGTTIRIENAEYEYTYAFYTTRWNEDYIYSYAYQNEQNWADYDRGRSIVDEGYSQNETQFEQKGYIRISVRRLDKERIPEDIFKQDPVIVLDSVSSQTVELCRKDAEREIRQCIQTVTKKREKGSLVFTLLSDSHITVNGTWQDTLDTIKRVDKEIRVDGIIHLGDFTDGLLNKKTCEYYADKVLQDLRSIHSRVYMTIGNHDTNYFKNNPELLSNEEIYEYYLKDIEATGKAKNQLWYYDDYEEQKLRMYFLHSYDHHDKLRYGYSIEEIAWLMDSLKGIPEDYRVIVFSHEAPIARLDYWTTEVRNGEKLLQELEQWHAAHNRRIMAFIHGHTHADYVYQERAFPIISIGCSKCEYFTDKKPEGAVTYRRVRHTVTQELWDTLVVNTEQNTLRFIRFGAGMDRKIQDGKLIKLQDNLMEEKKVTKIWAHRGASGYAPENTLKAFELAIDMGADGVELDVQFTKDRQIVVIHDETIDRVSNGSGRVVDYTLDELRQFSFNKTHPEYGNVGIPTLEEVLNLMKPTDLMINIELKTGINFYDGIEDSVLRLVERMGMQEQVIYSSFNHYSIVKIKELCPNAHTGFLYCDGTLHMAEYAQRYGVEALHPAQYNLQYIDLLPECRDRGIALHVWTVNSRTDLKQMVDLGVDAVITNYPDVAYEVVKGKKNDIKRQLPQPMDCLESIECKAEKSKEKNILLHALGIGYSKMRKIFVAIDACVQRAAGK